MTRLLIIDDDPVLTRMLEVVLPPKGFEVLVANSGSEGLNSVQQFNPDVIILDVRTGSDWKASEFKIKGADRASSDNVDSWAAKYAKDKTLVLYCA